MWIGYRFVSSLPHCAPGADHLTALDVMAEAEILQVVPAGQNESLHLLSIAGSPVVGAVVGVLAAAVEQVSWQRGDDDFLQLPCSLYYSLCSCEGRELTLLGRHHCLALSVELAIS